MLNVMIKAINAGTPSEYFVLVLDELNNFQILPYVPHYKTRAGAVRYALKHDYNIIERG